jgi:hypothetical protein
VTPYMRTRRLHLMLCRSSVQTSEVNESNLPEKTCCRVDRLKRGNANVCRYPRVGR